MTQLETSRLRLRLYSEQDIVDFVDLVTDRRVMRRVEGGHLTRDAAKNLHSKILNHLYPNGIRTIWAVFIKDGEPYIGSVSIRPRPEKPAEWEIGYIIKQDQWRQGFATEIARRLVAFGFSELGLDEIFATIDDDNTGSIKVAKNAGLSFNRYEYDKKGRFSVFSIRRGSPESGGAVENSKHDNPDGAGATLRVSGCILLDNELVSGQQPD